ncbi:multidrug resistance-associated protein 4-like [Actinia tenebrosa]|uniref:Multidrug resistance-associated protein 4-like n=1 Tax=Actinia tenebrosa TaxID=6105 RepID=A0A6P8H898_ACTTE|nr:multidrug resistance-associated protein 4-like [Actinia tenebrosa]
MEDLLVVLYSWFSCNNGCPSNLICQVSLVAPNWWLSRIATMPQQQQKNRVVLGVFSSLIAAAIIFSVTRAFANVVSIIRSLQRIHNKMFKAIFRSPVLFMDRNPVGRIMSRFCKDTGCVDESLPEKFAWTVMLCLYFAGVMILSVLVNFWMVVAIVPVLVIFLFIYWFNLKTSRELKRLEAVRCSPMYAHIADTINGLVVIRSSEKQKDFMKQFIR